MKSVRQQVYGQMRDEVIIAACVLRPLIAPWDEARLEIRLHLYKPRNLR